MYKQYFHFSELPFSIAPDPHFLFMSERHQEGLAHLLYGITMGGGFVALTGEVGTGKTTLCRCLLQQLPENVDIALILNPKLNAIELLTTICDELNIVYDGKRRTLKNFTDAINQYLLEAYANGRRTVLLIDEAQNLSLEVLEQIRLLTNLETSKTKLLQIILVGQPELKRLLSRRALRQLNQRITARYHLLPLSYDETKAYIQHRLTVSNGDPRLFKDRAIRKIYQFSGGIPRIINILCDRGLLGAYATNAQSISPEIIVRAAKETLGLLKPPAKSQPKTSHRDVVPAILMFLIGVGIAAGIYVFSQYGPRVHSAGRLPANPATAPVSMPAPAPEIQQSETGAPKPEVKPFNTWLNDPALTLNAAMVEALKAWQKTAPADNRIDCHYLTTVGLHCLSDKSDWQELLELDRPAILEFLLPSEERRYALLTGVFKGHPVLRFNEDMIFPLPEVLNFWNGHYLVLWQSPRSGMVDIAPQQLSSNVLWLRKQLSAAMGKAAPAEQPLYFDEALKAQLVQFQRQHHLTADGVAGARTLIHLDNQTGADGSLHLEMTD